MPRGSKPGERRGGRAKGVPNKINGTAAEIMRSLGCDPIAGMCRIAEDPSNSNELRLHAYRSLAPYKHPQLKAVELTGPAGGPIEVTTSPREQLAARIARIAERTEASGNH